MINKICTGTPSWYSRDKLCSSLNSIEDGISLAVRSVVTTGKGLSRLHLSQSILSQLKCIQPNGSMTDSMFVESRTSINETKTLLRQNQLARSPNQTASRKLVSHRLYTVLAEYTASTCSWRKALAQAKANPHVLTMCNSKKLLETFVESNKLLDSVQKGLADYLETKRLAFSRFFFLSNDELLQILSQTKNPLAVQPHLRKCFEAIDKLEFQEDLQVRAAQGLARFCFKPSVGSCHSLILRCLGPARVARSDWAY